MPFFQSKHNCQHFFLNGCVTSFWNISELTERPKGSRIHQYLPNGVENVVRRLDSLSRVQCQYPWLRSTLLKALALARSGGISSRSTN